jgi:uncharacterized protein (UPF0276 family)
MARSDPPAISPLGVGIVYNAGLEPLLLQEPKIIDVLEIEPQTMWMETPGHFGVVQARSEVDAHIEAMPWPKLIHSIGAPVGGSVAASELQLRLLRETTKRFRAPYASEHLAFNQAGDVFTGFFLPPRQIPAGIAAYATAIRRMQDALGVPLAIETGVNYLRPRADEIPDGDFLAELVNVADCGILLDLHNLYCNERNGRQSVEGFLARLPLDRVWEIHMAGGLELSGFWLDAHSGAIPDPLLAIAREVVPNLPNLKAIIFELFPSFLPIFGLDGVRDQMEHLRSLWALRRPTSARPTTRSVASILTSAGPNLREWEDALGSMVIGRSPRTPLDHELLADPGVPLVRALVEQFRASMVVGVYRLTSRFLMLALTQDVFTTLLQDFWSRYAPHQYAATEADMFYSDLEARGLNLPWFRKLLEFERATVLTIADSKTRTVCFDTNPLPMLRALAEGHLPTEVSQEGNYEIELTPDGPLTVSGINVAEVTRTFPFH